MKIITLCFWKRPEYAQAVLNSLKACAGVDRYTLLMHLDGGGHPDMPAVANSVDFASKVVIAHSDHAGCNWNTRRALAHGFNESDYVIHVEEDVILAPDALRWFEWASHLRDVKTIFTTNAWRNDVGWMPEQGRPFPPGEASRAVAMPFFNCWGWATWADRWREIDAGWTTGTDQSLSWDTSVQTTRGNRLGIQPHISRACNIGKEGGTHRGDYPLSYWGGSHGFVMPDYYHLV
jgi:hypothetical protein